MFKTFLSELRRRNVLPTILPYMGLVWLLLQVVVLVQPLLNLHPLVSPFVAVVLFAGFPVVLYLSWYFDFSFEGITPIKDLDGETPIHFGRGKWLVLLIITVGSGYLGSNYFGAIKTEMVKAGEGVSQIALANSIAVLPFRDQSPDQDQAYITVGLTEELTSLLGKVSELRVAATSSTLALAEKNLTPTDIGRRLQVDTVVTGSVRVTGNQLKIRTELVDTNDGTTMWTESFSREFKDIFAVEEEIARSIVNLLQDRYLEKGQVTSQAKTASTDAYVMYLKGREEYRKQTTESMKSARKYFEQAIALDPEYAQAYVGLADTVAMLAKGAAGFGHDAFFGVLDRDIASQLSLQNLDKALVRAPELAEAYAVRGLVLALLQDNVDEAISSLDKAISLNPSLAKAYMWKFLTLDHQARYSEAWGVLQKAYEFDPISIANQYNRGFYLQQKGQSEDAINQFNQLIEDHPDSPFGYAGLASVSYSKGNLLLSLKQWLKALQRSPDNLNFKRYYIEVLTLLGLVDAAKASTDDQFWTATFLLIDQKYNELYEEMSFQIAANPEDPWIQFEAGWYYLLTDETQKGLELVLGSYEKFNKNELYLMPHCSPAIEIAWALKMANRSEQATPLIEKCTTLLQQAESIQQSNSYNNYLSARLHVLKDNNQLARQELENAIDNGWIQWWTVKDPILSEVSTDEKVLLLFGELNQRIAEQKAKAEQFLNEIETAQN